MTCAARLPVSRGWRLRILDLTCMAQPPSQSSGGLGFFFGLFGVASEYVGWQPRFASVTCVARLPVSRGWRLRILDLTCMVQPPSRSSGGLGFFDFVLVWRSPQVVRVAA